MDQNYKNLEADIRRLKQLVAEHDRFIRGANQSANTPLTADTASRNRFKQMLFASKIINFDNLLAQTQSVETIGVVGARPGDFVAVAPHGSALVSTGVVYSAYVSANDVVTVVAANTDNVANDPSSGTFVVIVIKQ